MGPYGNIDRELFQQMPDLREKFVDAAVDGSGNDAESKLSIRGWLEGQIITLHQDEFPDAIARWTEVDSKPSRKFSGTAVLVTWALISLALLFPFYLLLKDTDDLYAAWSGGRGILSLGEVDSGKWDTLDHIAADKRLLFRVRGEPALRRTEHLWKSEPANPACFSEYAVAYRREKHGLPPDFSAIVDRIDPDNAWFDHLAAISAMIDRSDLDEALEHLRTGEGKKRYQSYAGSMLAERLRSFVPEDATQRMRFDRLLWKVSNPDHWEIVEWFPEYGWEMAAKGDAAAFRKLLEIREIMIRRRLQGASPGDRGEFITLRMVEEFLRTLHEAALKLELAEEASELAGEMERIETRRTERWESDALRRTLSLLHDHGGFVAYHSLSTVVSEVKTPPPLSGEELMPGRLLEHDRMARSYAILLWSFLGVVAMGVFFCRFRFPRAPWWVAGRVESLLRWPDWAWIIGAGVILPVAGFLFALVFTPFGGRDRWAINWGYDLDGTGLRAPFAVFGGLLLVMPLVIARWRLARRAGMFGFARRWMVGGLMVACLLVLLAGFWTGIELWPPSWGDGVPQWVRRTWPRMLLGGLPGLWLLSLAGMAMFSTSRNLLPRMVMARVMLKAHIAAMAALVFTVSGFHVSQQYWFTQDRFMSPDASEPSFLSSYGYRVSEQLRRETAEFWNER